MTQPALQHPFEPNELFPGICTHYDTWSGGQAMCGLAESADVHSQVTDRPADEPV